MGATEDLKVPEEDKKDKDFFEIVGSFGFWQKRVFAIFFIVMIVGIWQSFAITFLAPNMDFWCISPSPQNESSSFLMLFKDSVNETRNVSTGWKNYDIKDQCEVPVHLQRSDSSVVENYTKTVKCEKWDYDKSIYSDTIVSEWDLVCENEWLVSLAKSVYMAGFLVSVVSFGQLSDCIGRFRTIIISYVITVVSMLMSIWSTSYLMFIVLRFFVAFGRTGLTTTGYVLMMEIISEKHQTEVGIAIQLGWSVGFIILPGLAYFVRHWFWFQVASSIPILPLIFVYKFIPESPRWLLMQGKLKQLENLLSKAAKLNGRELKCDVKDLNLLKKAENEKEGSKTKTIIDVFKTPRLAKRVTNMIYLWIVNAFMYYGLSYNTNDLAGNPYLNFFISGLLELPSYAVVFYGIKSQGRRITLVVLMLIGGTACGAMIFVPQHLPWLNTAFAMVGKFCITGSFGILYLYTCELFPTVVRNAVVGCCSMCARFGSITAPFVRELGKATYVWVPNLAFASLAISSGLFALLLPETKGEKTPDTLEEGENFGLKSTPASTQQEPKYSTKENT